MQSKDDEREALPVTVSSSRRGKRGIGMVLVALLAMSAGCSRRQTEAGSGGAAGMDAPKDAASEPAPVSPSDGAPDQAPVDFASDASDASDAADGFTPPSRLYGLQRDYVGLRFGMFLHFGILTFCGSRPTDPCPGTWAQPNLDISKFSPSDSYNPGQWADAAVAAHMRFGVLTTRHHDGFALWPSNAGTFNVKSIPWKNGQGDVVRDYVDAFRSRGLLPGLYYSIWDSTEGIGGSTNTGPAPMITPAQLDYVKTQITELLTNYGPIPILVIDGWSWRMGHRAVAYQQIRELVKSLQPDCLLTDHTHLADPWDVDIVNFEEPTGAFAPAGNTYAAEQDTKINGSGGNDWFWNPDVANLLSVTAIVNTHLAMLEPRYTNFILNCPPNRDGLLDAAMVSRLADVGAAWSPDPSRPPLPLQGALIEHPYTPVSATATTGNAALAIDGINDTARHTSWQSAGALPQSITVDLGQTHPDVGMVSYVPPYTMTDRGTAAGAVTGYGILVSTDGSSFAEVSSGNWAADGKMKTATFAPVAARYVRFEVRAAMGAAAIVTDLTIGANRM